MNYADQQGNEHDEIVFTKYQQRWPLGARLHCHLFVSGVGFAFAFCLWLGLALVLSGIFVLFEALRGWCALRACGIKTRL
jgi:hypothetical protein